MSGYSELIRGYLSVLNYYSAYDTKMQKEWLRGLKNASNWQYINPKYKK